MKKRLCDATTLSQITAVRDNSLKFNNFDFSLLGFLTKKLHFFNHLQDLNNFNIHREAVSGYSAPGGPINYPFYRVHGNELSPKPSSPTSPSMLRTSSTSSRNSFNFLPSSPTSSPSSPFAAHREGHLDPKQLVNTAPSDLPDGIDPSRKEVSVTFRGQEVHVLI